LAKVEGTVIGVVTPAVDTETFTRGAAIAACAVIAVITGANVGSIRATRLCITDIERTGVTIVTVGRRAHTNLVSTDVIHGARVPVITGAWLGGILTANSGITAIQTARIVVITIQRLKRRTLPGVGAGLTHGACIPVVAYFSWLHLEDTSTRDV
jgi:hypothetical protein